jgi:putative endonuclease
MTGWVYMMASGRNGALYAGVTSDLQDRAYQHKSGDTPGFTSKYGCKDLVCYERHDNIVEAIVREKDIKKYRRKWKLDLIEAFNPQWTDLYETCYEFDNPSDAIRAREYG